MKLEPQDWQVTFMTLCFTVAQTRPALTFSGAESQASTSVTSKSTYTFCTSS